MGSKRSGQWNEPPEPPEVAECGCPVFFGRLEADGTLERRIEHRFGRCRLRPVLREFV